MTSPKTATQRKQDERDRMRERGFVLLQAWIHPSDRARVQAYLARLLKARRR